MSEEERQAILARLPAAQRTKAVRRIALAEKYGWAGIRLWEEEGLGDIEDLAGVNPHGQFDFLPAEEPA